MSQYSLLWSLGFLWNRTIYHTVVSIYTQSFKSHIWLIPYSWNYIVSHLDSNQVQQVKDYVKLYGTIIFYVILNQTKTDNKNLQDYTFVWSCFKSFCSTLFVGNWTQSLL